MPPFLSCRVMLQYCLHWQLINWHLSLAQSVERKHIFMPRPSVQSARLNEIVAAAAKCVAQYGLEGVTLVRIAAETGLKRPLIRHHAGNREEIINAVVTHVLAEFEELTKYYAQALPKKNASYAAVDYLFDSQSHSDPAEMMVSQSIVATGERVPTECAALLKWVDDFTLVIAEAIR